MDSVSISEYNSICASVFTLWSIRAMASETVRIKPDTHAKLTELAKAAGESLTDTLERAVETLRRQKVLEAVNAGYADLRRDKKAWNAWQAELAAWDQTTSDGLESD